MPKKSVAKGKKPKAGKGKKDSKQESKVDKESDLERARTNDALWELRLRIKERSLKEIGEACDKLGRANLELSNKLYRAEKDSMDMSDYLMRQVDAKEEEINMLQKTLKSQELLACEEQNKLAEDYMLQINELKELLRKRSSDFDMIQDGMKKMKEFEKTKFQMEQEISDIRESMEAAEKAYRENLNEMECKFINEKNQLEREAEKRIASVEKKAHAEAIKQLDDTSRSIFRENVRLNEELKYYVQATEKFTKETNSLLQQVDSLAQDKQKYGLMAKKNMAQIKAQKEELSQLRAKVASLETTLEVKAEEYEQMMERGKEKTQASQVELEKLQKVLAMRERELGHILRSARTIVEQRTDLEKFCHEALAQVRQEIMASRLQYKKEALQAYRWKMREATAGRLKFPPIRTFHKSPHSTNSVYADMETAVRWTHQPGSKVYITDLTWEQKERVLNILFSKMNGQTTRKICQHGAPSASTDKESLIDSDAAGIKEEQPSETFITEAPEPALPLNPHSQPVHTPHDL